MKAKVVTSVTGPHGILLFRNIHAARFKMHRVGFRAFKSPRRANGTDLYSLR